MIAPLSAAKATCIPLAMVMAYTLVLLVSDRVSVGDVVSMQLTYALRLPVTVLLLALAVAPVYLLVKLLQGETAEPPVRLLLSRIEQGWARDRLASVAAPALLLIVLLSSFTLFKQRVLPQAGFGGDPAFAAADEMLFAGWHPWQLSHFLFSSEIWSRLFDIAYAVWFLPLFLSVLLSWMMPLALRTQYLMAFTLCWIVIGTFLAYLLPSAGPCYFQQFHGSSEFAPLMERLRDQDEALRAVGGSGILALVGQKELLTWFQSGELTMAAGISAMPSMHNALAALFACGAFTIHRVAGLVMTVFAIVIWIGSVHLGWHYAVDGIVAVGVTIAIWKGCGALVAFLMKDPRLSPLSPALTAA